ncbi:hypothetical protein [Methylomonas koyamae]|uniref:hypothetical protein n=1 Tax=Methylomonas koyamae TaxID=702114 RepID=UPI00287361AF|nr:hypothetical protein [Methylomonas koyamae]WNB76781.1 hypothetical protein RI210_04205 [Methylomonas koyamae]
MEQTPPFLQSPVIPFMAQTKFADMTGFSLGVIEGWVVRGYVPSMVVGKHRVINLVALFQQCIDLDQLPK